MASFRLPTKILRFEETQQLEIEYPVSTDRSKSEVAIRGWNVMPSRALAVQGK
jgi:hypothetical protein